MDTHTRYLGAAELATIEVIMRSAVLVPLLQMREDLHAGPGRTTVKIVDGTLGTEADDRNQQSIVTRLAWDLQVAGLANLVGLVAEEMKFSVLDQVVKGRRYVIVIDPGDGTALGSMSAPGMTVGAQLVDMIDGHIVASVVADPFGGRLVYTKSGQTYADRLDPTTLQPIGQEQPCHVSDREISDSRSHVLIEVQHGFTRREWIVGGKREILDNYQIVALTRLIQQIGQTGTGRWGRGPTVRSCSSNLMHNVLVAMGGATAFITTAIGGVWDLTGLVQGAGGVVRYFRVNRLENGRYELAEVGSPLLADIVIGGNSPRTVQVLHDTLYMAINLGH